MKDKLSAFTVKFRNLMWREEGQDMIEYTLLIFLAALAVSVGMKALATGIDAAFTNIAAMTSTYSGRSSGSASATALVQVQAEMQAEIPMGTAMATPSINRFVSLYKGACTQQGD